VSVHKRLETEDREIFDPHDVLHFSGRFGQKSWADSCTLSECVIENRIAPTI
jgi:hypothetical protein